MASASYGSHNTAEATASTPSAAQSTASGGGLERTVLFVNTELASAGFPDILDFSGFAGSDEDGSKVLNCICTLLLQRQKDVAFRDDLQYRLRRVSADNDNLAGTVARQKARLEQCEREISSLQNKNDTLQTSLKREAEKLSVAREELKATKANLQYSKTQYNHDVRKRDRDFARLKDRMQRTVNEKTKMTLINPLAKPLSSIGSSKQRNNNTDADVMYGVVMRNYEDRERELLSENQMLRDTLFETFRELKDRFADAGGHDPRDHELGAGPVPSSSSSPPESRDEDEEEDPEAAMERAHFQLPFNLVQNTVQQRIRHVMMDLKAEWDELMEKIEGEQHPEMVVELEQQIAELHNQNDEYQRIIEEQNRILESSLNGTAAVRHEGDSAMSDDIRAAPGWDSSIMDLAEQKAELEAKVRQLEIDRINFTDAALKLGVERANLQREKKYFNDERRKALGTDDFLKTLPETPGWLRARAKAEEDMDRVPATPSRAATEYKQERHDGDEREDPDEQDGDATPRPFNSTMSTVQPTTTHMHERYNNHTHGDHARQADRHDERKLSSPDRADPIAHESDTLTQTPSTAHWRGGAARDDDDAHGFSESEADEEQHSVHHHEHDDDDDEHDNNHDVTVATMPLSSSARLAPPQRAPLSSSRSTSATVSTPSYIRSAMKKVERMPAGGGGHNSLMVSTRTTTTSTATTAAPSSSSMASVTRNVRLAVGEEPEGRSFFRPGESDGKENAGPAIEGSAGNGNRADAAVVAATKTASRGLPAGGEKKGFVATSTPNNPVGRVPLRGAVRPPVAGMNAGARRPPARKAIPKTTRPPSSLSSTTTTAAPRRIARAAE
ncbi:Afadin- and alpha-actinin-binding protein [Geranomyces variabilis]|uniref:Afadin- and alpha-actinin-binding protein n=1 Tax=Geranomyces variabilis TaxID=109894 RepID=A0AAD5TG72_9FUNG|nr:Afadin- and alpha-actinin-binding protein [Geranomyces variabilis]